MGYSVKIGGVLNDDWQIVIVSSLRNQAAEMIVG